MEGFKVSDLPLITTGRVKAIAGRLLRHAQSGRENGLTDATCGPLGFDPAMNYTVVSIHVWKVTG